MSLRSAVMRVPFASMAKVFAVLACLGATLMLAACGIKVSSSDFPGFKLSEPVAEAEAAAKPEQ